MGTEEIIEAFLERLRRKNYRKSTLCTYGEQLDYFTAYLTAQGVDRLQDVAESHLIGYAAYMRGRDLVPSTVHARLVLLRRFFAWAQKEGLVLVDPAELIELKQPSRPMMYVPSEHDVQRLLAQPRVSRPVGVRDRAILEVLYGSGLRVHELCSLSLGDPDVRQRRVRVLGKGARERVVPLSHPAVHWLALYIEHARETFHPSPSETALWISVFHGPLDTAGVQHMLERYRKQGRLHPSINPHALRRACATHLLQHGAHPVAVQTLLGHATLRHLGRYLKVNIQDLQHTHQRSKPGR